MPLQLENLLLNSFPFPNCLFNGFLKIKSFENKIKIFTDNYILFEGNTLNGNLDGHGIIYYENDNKSFEGEFLKGHFINLHRMAVSDLLAISEIQ